MSKVYHSPSKHAPFVFERFSKYILNKFETLGAVSIAVATKDKLYLIHKNFQNNERKVNNSFSQSSLGMYTFKHEKGYSNIKKPSILLIMHVKDIQKVILRYIIETYPG